MKKIFLMLIMIILFSNIAYAQTCIYFFYGEGCPHCGRVEPIIAEKQNDY